MFYPCMKTIFTVKPLNHIFAEASQEKQHLRRALGPVHITLLGIGGIIGAGIFATIGTAAAGDLNRLGAGPGLVLSFVIAGLVCACAAFCYAEFASMVPISGSAYTYTYATLGELMAWVIGWDLIIEYAVGNVAVAISWANYFKTFLREAGIVVPDWISTDFVTAHKIPGLMENAPHLFGVPIVVNLLAALIVLAIGVVLLIGIRESAWFNAGMVTIKLIVLGFFIFLGTRYLQADNWHPFLPNGMPGVLSGAAVIFFAYIGFDAVSTLAEEAKNPQRDLPMGIIGSLIICTIIYVIVAGVFTGMIPYSALVKTLSTQQAEPLTLALDYCQIKGMAIFIVAAGAVVAHTAVLFVFQLGQPRIFFAMARDGLLPRPFALVHPRFQTPWWSTILTSLAVAFAAMFTSLDEMVDLTNVGTLFAFILVAVGIMILRVREPGRERPFRVPFGNFLLPMCCVAGCLGLIYYLPPTSWLRFAAWLNIGFLIYFCYGSRHSRLTGLGQTSEPAAHCARTALSGALLGFIGTTLVVLARVVDVLRGSGKPLGATLLENSWWLSFPLLLNLLVYCPLVVRRALGARGVAGAWPVARRAVGLTAALAALIALCLLATLG